MPIQQTLALKWHGLPPTFETFRVGQNTVTYQVITHWLQQPSSFTSLYVWGEHGCGKTHLLQAACRHLSERGGLSAYLPLSEFFALSTDVLEGLEYMDLVCLDDLHSISRTDSWEQAIFSLYNTLKDNNTPLLVAADVPPAQLTILADLKSRLTGGGVYHLERLSDSEQCTLLQAYAAELGLILPDSLAQYFISKNKNLKTTTRWLDQLDGLAGGKKRKLSLHFVKEVLKI